VWNMLTLPERLAEWLALGSIEPRLGGTVKLSFSDSGTVINSTVTAFAKLRLMEYSWSIPGQPLRPVRWEVQAVGGGTRLILFVSVPQDEDIARTCAGWEAHLMMLLAAIEGAPIKFPFERFKSARDSYNTKVELLN
jgi:uncharacterized protein YndB with AHSA1/START domain